LCSKRVFLVFRGNSELRILFFDGSMNKKLIQKASCGLFVFAL
jgi:hypothetical protein